METGKTQHKRLTRRSKTNDKGHWQDAQDLALTEALACGDTTILDAELVEEAEGNPESNNE